MYSDGEINDLFLRLGSQDAVIQYISDNPKGKIKPEVFPAWSNAVANHAAKKQEVSTPVVNVPEPTVRQRFKEYKREVWRLTESQPLYLLDNHSKRGFKSYHLDHVLSIWEGFKRGLPCAAVADLSNLRYIPHVDNMKKGTRRVYTNLFNEDII